MPGLLRVAALVLFLAAALSLFGWLIHLGTVHAIGCIAAGLLLWLLSTLDIPTPPA